MGSLSLQNKPMDNSTLLRLHEDLQHYHALAERAIRDKDFDRHFVLGGQFHRTASRIQRLTGVDPRERYA